MIAYGQMLSGIGWLPLDNPDVIAVLTLQKNASLYVDAIDDGFSDPHEYVETVPGMLNYVFAGRLRSGTTPFCPIP